MDTESVVQSFVYQRAPILSRITQNLSDSQHCRLASEVSPASATKLKQVS